MGGVQRVVFLLGAAQQVEFLETRNLVQMAVPLRPDALERGFLALDDAKAVHGDKHFFLRGPWSPDTGPRHGSIVSLGRGLLLAMNARTQGFSRWPENPHWNGYFRLDSGAFRKRGA